MKTCTQAMATLLCSLALAAGAHADQPPSPDSIACAPAVFEPLGSDVAAGPDKDWVPLAAGPVATLAVPAPLAHLGLSPAGALVFRSQGGQVSGGVSYETRASVQLHEADAVPAAFFSAVFRGQHPAACLYAAGMRLHEQDHRWHVQLQGGEVFAFGQGSSHHFFVINRAQPDLVLNGALQGVPASVLRQLLARIRLQ